MVISEDASVEDVLNLQMRAEGIVLATKSRRLSIAESIRLTLPGIEQQRSSCNQPVKLPTIIDS